MIPHWSKTSTPQTAQGKRMSTVNARTDRMEKSPTLRPLMSRMHKLKRDRATKQLIFDKRSLVLLEEHDFDR